MPTTYWVLENEDGNYYRGYRETWSSHLHYALPLTEHLALQLKKRYPKATISEEAGYAVNPRWSFQDIGEPDAARFLAEAVRIASTEMSLETILFQTEKAYHAAVRT